MLPLQYINIYKKTVNAVCLLQMENVKQKFVSLGWQTINSNRCLLFQQTCYLCTKYIHFWAEVAGPVRKRLLRGASITENRSNQEAKDTTDGRICTFYSFFFCGPMGEKQVLPPLVGKVIICVDFIFFEDKK
jgi:hypothetical protein